MGFPTKVQLIKRKNSEQWYINFPSALAQAMEFSRGEVVEWLVEDKEMLLLHRPNAKARQLKKKLPDRSSKGLKPSSQDATKPSGSKELRKRQKGSP
jgi:hypothetical protein